jgi:hypothetical protein
MKIIAGLEPNDMRVLNVSIDETVEKVAVTFSGGMDSTLLLYMLIKDKEDRGLTTAIHCYTATQCGTKIHSQNVLALPEFAGKVIHHLDVENPINESVKPVTDGLLKDGWVVYGASNAVPLEQIGGRYPPRNAKNPENPNCHLPFLFLFKYHILNTYAQLGIEHILPVTHTCTELAEGECGHCFACLEREWAFAKLGMNKC